MGEPYCYHHDNLKISPPPMAQAMESPDHLLANFAVELLRRAGHLPCVTSNRPRLALKEVMWKLELQMGQMSPENGNARGSLGGFVTC